MDSKFPINKVLTAVLLVTILILAFQNCSPKTSFKEVSIASQASVVVPPPTDQPPPQPPQEPSLITPKYSLFKEPCLAGDECVIHVILDRVAEKDFSFNWKTNDTIYLSNPDFLKPNVHYVPTQGTLVIALGKSEGIYKIKSISSPQLPAGNKDYNIGITTSNCKYGSIVLSCKDIKE